MASAEDPTTVFGEEDLDEDEDDDSEEEEENIALPSHQDDDVLDEDDEDDEDDDVLDEASASPSTSGDPHVSSSSAAAPIAAVPVVTVAVPGVPNGEPIPAAVDSAADPKRPRAGEEKKPFDESRRLFQRLWTDEDEIELLQGFLDYSAQRGPNSSSHHHDTNAFYDQIKSKLQLDFNKNQLVEKLRRLKKKYRNVMNRIGSGKEFSFKSPHDQSTFEISRKIWSTAAIIGVPEETGLEDDDANPNSNPATNPSPNPNSTARGFNSYSIDVNSAEKKVPRSRKRSRAKLDEKPVLNNQNHKTPSTIPSLIEETVRSCLSPLFKELLHNSVNGPSCGVRGFGGMALNPLPLSFGGTEVTDEKWRKQQILELEVYSKRLELVQEQIRSALQELRGMGS